MTVTQFNESTFSPRKPLFNSQQHYRSVLRLFLQKQFDKCLEQCQFALSHIHESEDLRDSFIAKACACKCHLGIENICKDSCLEIFREYYKDLQSVSKETMTLCTLVLCRENKFFLAKELLGEWLSIQENGCKDESIKRLYELYLTNILVNTKEETISTNLINNDDNFTDSEKTVSINVLERDKEGVLEKQQIVSHSEIEKANVNQEPTRYLDTEYIYKSFRQLIDRTSSSFNRLIVRLDVRKLITWILLICVVFKSRTLLSALIKKYKLRNPRIIGRLM
ncbi:hypothetical protein ROZALSC1DRAFT_23720 [Rozella allomycis CSF55]|uniref:Uncharacterized protein n=1 Tax=Rozella allomycis (strain CSF55) TaxID=988480 RepID=A0A4P9YGZ3_ROZAC|nr:hypothetical protein ROZALSC1DRAFT_23720 [Rozella allomycis CSF55]